MYYKIIITLFLDHQGERGEDQIVGKHPEGARFENEGDATPESEIQRGKKHTHRAHKAIRESTEQPGGGGM